MLCNTYDKSYGISCYSSFIMDLNIIFTENVSHLYDVLQ